MNSGMVEYALRTIQTDYQSVTREEIVDVLTGTQTVAPLPMAFCAAHECGLIRVVNVFDLDVHYRLTLTGEEVLALFENPCPACAGMGGHLEGGDFEVGIEWVICPVCGGSGAISEASSEIISEVSH